MKQALSQVGIAVDVRTQDFPSYVKRVYTDRDFAFTTNSMTNTFDPTVGVQRLYWSKNFKPGVPFSNGAHYESAEADRLLEAAAVEIDPVKRKQLWTDLQKLVIADLPDLNLISDDNLRSSTSASSMRWRMQAASPATWPAPIWPIRSSDPLRRRCTGAAVRPQAPSL